MRTRLGRLARPVLAAARILCSCLALTFGAGMFIAAPASADGTVMAWGGNSEGQLGNGTTTNSDVPAPVSLSLPPGVTVTEVASGAGQTLALLSNGTVVAWGSGAGGTLGDGTVTSSDVPVPVCAVGATAPCSAANGNILTGVTAVTAGSANSLALLSNGTVVGWGENYGGSLGIGNAVFIHDVPLPVCAEGATAPCSAANGNILTGVTAISSAGLSHTFALLSNQTVVAWGVAGIFNTLGDGIEGGGSHVPVPVCAVGAKAPCSEANGNVLTGVTAVKGGGNASIALLSDGTVVDWGRRPQVVLKVPAQVAGLSGVTAISAGNYSFMALLGNGTVMTWGKNEWGELGDDGSLASSQQNPTPVCAVGAVAPCSAANGNVLSGATAIAYAPETGLALALLSNSSVVSWGENETGGLGIGTETGPETCEFSVQCTRTPLPVAGLGGATAISSGGFGGVAATLLANTASGHSTSSSTPATVTDGPLSATASGGTGTVTVGQYASNPAGSLSFMSSGKFIDVNLSPGSSFTSLTFEDCELGGGLSLKWWNPHGYNSHTLSDSGEWETVKRQAYDPTTKCVTVEIEASGTEPTLEEMSGTIFGAALAATVKPEVTLQPAGDTVTAGEAASFTAEASGNPTPTVQWEVSKHGGAFEEIAGATSDTYAIASAATSESGDEYEAVFTNEKGDATSKPATLTVNPPKVKPEVTVQPANETVTAGETASFMAEASGNPTPTVQWWVSKHGGAFEEVSGATSDTYTIPGTATSESGYEYEAVFSNEKGEATSSPATLTVNPPKVKPEVTLQPANETVTAGETASFTAEASGNPTPTVQWWVSKHGGPFEEVSGATSDTYTIPGTATSESGYEYEAVFSNEKGEATSNPATLTVNPATSAPVNTGLPAISQTGKLLSCSSGSWTGNPSPTFAYQWLRDGHTIEGAVGSSYSIHGADKGHTLTCEVTASNLAGHQSATSAGTLIPLAGCSDYWINTAGGSWYTAGDWSSGAPPTSGEEACILANGTYTVTMEQTLASVSVQSLKIGGEEGTQTLVVASTCSQEAQLVSSAGISNGAKGAITMTNAGLCANNVTLAGAVSNAGALDVEEAQGGARSIDGSLINAKDLSLAAGASLQITGSYTQTAKGKLHTTIAGPSSFGSLSASGAATLEGGGLISEQTAPFSASAGESFAILSSAGLTGTFAKQTGEKINSSGLYYKPLYSAGGVALQATQATLTLSTSSGAPGSTVTLTGSGYIPGDTIIPFVTAAGEETEFPAATANTNGELETTVTIPAVAPGNAKIRVKGTQTPVSITKTFKIT